MKNNKGFIGLGLILAIIAVLAIGGSAYYLGIKNSFVPQNIEVNNSKSVENNDKVNTEESLSETFENQPGVIKSIKVNGINNWILAVDLLSRNPNWLPGVDSTGEFFINQNPKIRNLNVTRDTKAYNCGVDMKPDVLVNTTTFISNIQKSSYKTVYFDIDGVNITAIYQQCLP